MAPHRLCCCLRSKVPNASSYFSHESHNPQYRSPQYHSAVPSHLSFIVSAQRVLLCRPLLHLLHCAELRGVTVDVCCCLLASSMGCLLNLPRHVIGRAGCIPGPLGVQHHCLWLGQPSSLPAVCCSERIGTCCRQLRRLALCRAPAVKPVRMDLAAVQRL